MNTSYDIEPLLESLEQKLDLQIDRHLEGGLSLKLNQKYKIQIEFLEDRIIMSSILGELLPSRYRQQVFEDALRANFKSIVHGTIAYNDRNKFLIIILNYPIIPPVLEEFMSLFDGFVIKTKAWTDALVASNTRLLI
jgi:hypothetical protein